MKQMNEGFDVRWKNSILAFALVYYVKYVPEKEKKIVIGDNNDNYNRSAMAKSAI